LYLDIANAVAGNLLLPEIAAGVGPPEKMTVVPVPEAPVNQHDSAMTRQDNVGLAREFRGMESVP
jgi:hypothetical protein